jgi:hypothetical protein
VVLICRLLCIVSSSLNCLWLMTGDVACWLYYSCFHLYSMLGLWFYCSQSFKLFGFPIFRFWAYLMKHVVRTKFDIYVFINAVSQNIKFVFMRLPRRKEKFTDPFPMFFITEYTYTLYFKTLQYCWFSFSPLF